MPALMSFSAAEEEKDHLLHSPEADRLNPEAEEKEEDPEKMNEKDTNDNESEDEDVERDEEKEDEVEAEVEEALEEEGEGEDSEKRSQASSAGEQSQSEFMDIELGDIRRDLQCPICLGIIRKTRTVMECLHRFCRECIDKSIRLGNNECPTCRKHCASRRSLRDDPKFDAFIATLFKDIDQFEAEELDFREDDEARNKQIQESIAQVSQRQSETLVKRRSSGKEAAVLSTSRRIGSGSRRRRNCRNMENNASEEAHDDDDNNNRAKDSSSDEPCTEILQRKRKRRSTTHPSTSNANKNDNFGDNNTEEAHLRDSRGISPGLVWNPELLAWGRGGTRSNTRQGNNNQGAGSKSVTIRNARLNRLVEYLGSLQSNSVESDIHLKLISLDTKCLPDLLQPYLCCRPTLLIKQLRDYVALQMQRKAEEVELLVSKGKDETTEDKSPSAKMLSLKDDKTLAELRVKSSHESMIVVYRQMQIG